MSTFVASNNGRCINLLKINAPCIYEPGEDVDSSKDGFHLVVVQKAFRITVRVQRTATTSISMSVADTMNDRRSTQSGRASEGSVSVAPTDSFHDGEDTQVSEYIDASCPSVSPSYTVTAPEKNDIRQDLIRQPVPPLSPSTFTGSSKERSSRLSSPSTLIGTEPPPFLTAPAPSSGQESPRRPAVPPPLPPLPPGWELRTVFSDELTSQAFWRGNRRSIRQGQSATAMTVDEQTEALLEWYRKTGHNPALRDRSPPCNVSRQEMEEAIRMGLDPVAWFMPAPPPPLPPAVAMRREDVDSRTSNSSVVDKDQDMDSLEDTGLWNFQSRGTGLTETKD